MIFYDPMIYVVKKNKVIGIHQFYNASAIESLSYNGSCFTT
jgi:hypothetical protein